MRLKHLQTHALLVPQAHLSPPCLLAFVVILSSTTPLGRVPAVSKWGKAFSDAVAAKVAELRSSS